MNVPRTAHLYFNTPPRTGRNNDVRVVMCYIQDFNTPPRTGRNSKGEKRYESKINFNTPPRTGRNFLAVFLVIFFWISIHLPARGGISRKKEVMSLERFQYTSPHGEEWLEPVNVAILNAISIHLPARGGIITSS